MIPKTREALCISFVCGHSRDSGFAESSHYLGSRSNESERWILDRTQLGIQIIRTIYTDGIKGNELRYCSIIFLVGSICT
jgi:hypothetical protein